MTIAHRLGFTLIIASALAVLALVAARDVSAEGARPEFLFPWQDGQTWVMGAAGFHYTNDALDFFPPDTDSSWEIHCEGDPDWVLEVSSYWILASAAGAVAYSAPPYVLLDHGGGWFSRYYHVEEPQVSVGDFVAAGTRLGHPSTRGDCTTGSHIHFWVQGPNGETTKNVSLSGIPATNLGVNEPHSETANFDAGNPPQSPTPTPTETPEPIPSPTLGPSEEPTPTPSPSGPPTPTPDPIPGVFPSGDADCSGLVTLVDVILILQFAAGIPSSDCAATHSETNCDGSVTVADAMTVLQMTLGPVPGREPAGICSDATPGPQTPAQQPADESTPTAAPELTLTPVVVPVTESPGSVPSPSP